MLQKIANYVWNEDRHLRAIHMLGIAMFGVTYAVGIYWFVIEAPQIWQLGWKALLLDGATRLLAGGLFTSITVIPYAAASVAAFRTGKTRVFAWLCGGIWIVQLVMNLNMTLFPDSSTAGIGVFFLPFYLGVPVLILWVLYIWGVLGTEA